MKYLALVVLLAGCGAPEQRSIQQPVIPTNDGRLERIERMLDAITNDRRNQHIKNECYIGCYAQYSKAEGQPWEEFYESAEGQALDRCSNKCERLPGDPTDGC
jgi:hypothetical protein